MIGNRLSNCYDKFCEYMERDTKGVEVSMVFFFREKYKMFRNSYR